MKIIATAILVLSCAAGLAIAQTTPVTPAVPAATAAVPAADRPTDDSIRQLLQIQKTQSVLRQVAKQVDGSFTAMLNQQLQDKTLSDEDRQRIEAARARLHALTGKILTWENMEPMYLKIYGDSFSQSEIDSMIAFYSSPAGQAVVAKLPLVAQNTMAAMQKQMKDLMPQAQQIAKDTATEINEKHSKSAKPSAG
jgi:uncharacterized protein